MLPDLERLPMVACPVPTLRGLAIHRPRQIYKPCFQNTLSELPVERTGTEDVTRSVSRVNREVLPDLPKPSRRL